MSGNQSIMRMAFYALAIIAGLGVAYGLYQAKTYMTVKAMDVPEEVEQQVLAETYSSKRQTNTDGNNAIEEEVVVISEENPEGGMTMIPDYDESRFAPPPKTAQENIRESQAGAKPVNCSVDYLEGKLYVEYDGQIVKGQRVSPEGSVSLSELKQIRTKLRIVQPGEMVTMDFVPDRLTIELDEMGFIDRAYCG